MEEPKPAATPGDPDAGAFPMIEMMAPFFGIVLALQVLSFLVLMVGLVKGVFTATADGRGPYAAPFDFVIFFSIFGPAFTTWVCILGFAELIRVVKEIERKLESSAK